MCPFAERSDPRCSVRLTLSALEYAMEYCACEYRQCPIYRELQQHTNAERRRELAPAG